MKVLDNKTTEMKKGDLKRLVLSMRWLVRHKDILKFVDDVEGMEAHAE